MSDPAHTEAYADAWAKRTRADRDIARAWFARARTDVAALNPQVIVEAQKTVDFCRVGADQGLPGGEPVRYLVCGGIRALSFLYRR